MSPPAPHHRFTVSGQHGQLAYKVEASLNAPWTILFGPSGSGKSTVLRALAGLIQPLDARFERYNPAGDQWLQLHTLPPQQRALAYDPQQALLLPHRTAAQNIRFPEDLRHVPFSQSLVPAIIDLLHLEPLLAKRPHQLSGGERQRISLARALAVPNAQLLLLDEPFAGLDRTLRDDLLPRLQRHLLRRQLPVLSVTHDPDEVLLLGAQVLRLHDGKLTAQGAASEVLKDEISRLSAILGSADSRAEP